MTLSLFVDKNRPQWEKRQVKSCKILPFVGIKAGKILPFVGINGITVLQRRE
ncbi:hypothetical protein LTSEUGA_2461 [Salmonella enterica subsp. enterica serovar Uganda str. R8-3404]|uniref:Uncharacterized protein n=1 Tax=Salmonella enterica subsp. enterica serovar Uganda str. R8-3404 TaxID=913083 RepID=A0A6C8H3U2_SALET|nr:hypothetical protein LTSEUGA_2461 [Salmonella enterica subsp. enterica serovar Uganda str. R8-3404]